MLINDEARITNDEGMTKSEAQKAGSADDLFRNRDAEWVIREEPEKNRVYDLEGRTAQFGEAVIDFAKRMPEDRSLSESLVKWSELEQALATITMKPTMQSEKGISKVHWDVQKRSTREQAFPTHGRSRCS